MTSVRKSLFLTFAQNYGAMSFQLGASIFIARLLTPAELGIFSVAAGLVGIAQTVRAFGVPTYIVQEKELTKDRIRSALTLTVLIGWLLAALVALSSGLVAEFYREPGVRGVMLVLALNFLLMPFGSVTMAYLVREMNFVPQALAGVASAAAQSVTAIALAFLGFGFMSLAWASVVATVVMIVVAQIYRPSHLPYLPGFREVKRVAAFGIMSTSALVVNDITQGVPDLIVGRMVNMEAVGLLGRANGLVQMFDKVVMNAVWRVATPYFSMHDREGGNVSDAFLKSVSLLTAIAWPFFIFLGLMAYPVIRIMFGPQWDASVPLVRYLCIAGFLTGPILLCGTVLIAIGRIQEMIRPLVGVAVAQVIVVLIASFWGVEAVAASFALVATLRSVWWYKTIRRVLNLNFREFATVLRKSAGVTLCAAVLPIVVVAISRPDPNNLWFPLALGAFGALAGWMAGIFVLDHPARVEIVRTFRFVKHRGGT